jgi:hypothetical protein
MTTTSHKITIKYMFYKRSETRIVTIFLGMLIVTYLAKKFFRFKETIKARQWTLSWVNSIQSNPIHILVD